ncbi:hypothetical protein FPV67DRAFT_1673016 [Lyophyllum atratum]|nr:hypothetical protein FPV67DRAFT_1673016 [Lyophyllum atratum]
MRPLDPLLIESFPAPPTHIPLTPTSPNPPLSRPPSTPLPPVPGPSRISGHESMFLLSAGRSRRSARISTASDSSRPPSTASPPHSPTSATHPHPIAFSISEEPVDFLRDAADDDALLDIAVPRHMPTPRRHQANESISEIDVRDILDAVVDDDDGPTDTDNDDILAALPPMPAPRTPLPPRKHTLSLADPIDPHTIQALTGPISRSLTFPPSASPRRTLFHEDKDEPLRSTPSPDIGAMLSKTPRPVLRSRVSSSASASSLGKTPRLELKRRASEGVTRARSTRRDPRVSDPTMRTSDRSSELPYVTPYRRYGDSPYGIYGDDELEDEAEDDDDTRSWIDHDEYGQPLPRHGKARQKSLSREEWSGEEEERVRLMRLERQLEGSDSEGSDSSLDLHTPLPHLMVRHGLLSPRSKLIAEPAFTGRESVASLASTLTMNTTTAKGPLKDARDTMERRARHKDGRLLKGGIGLTTGLGWSDSEDEDAPSALTRRLSALTLSRRSSLASAMSLSRSTSRISLSRKDSTMSHATSSTSRTHPLSRSYSSGQLAGAFADEEEVDEWGARRTRGGQSEDMHLSHSLGRTGTRTPTRWSSNSLPSSGGSKGRVGGPPTSWTPGKGGKKRSGSGSTRTSVASTGSSAGGGRGDMIPEGEEEEGLGLSVHHLSYNGSTTNLTPSPSTASTLSIPLPITPLDCEVEEAAGVKGAQLKREKSLPPLPPALRRSPGSTNLGGLNVSQAQGGSLSKSTGPSMRSFAFPESRTRTVSGSSAGSAVRSRTSTSGSQENAARATTTPVPMNMKSTPAPTMMSTPRPLRLAQVPLLKPASMSALPSPSPRMLPRPSPSPGLLPRSGSLGDRPAVPVPGVRGYASRSLSPMPLGALPPTPKTPTTPVERPKPRTGTGMVYRSTGSASRMRVPSNVTRPPATASGRGIGIAL